MMLIKRAGWLLAKRGAGQRLVQKILWRWLIFSPANPHEYFELELPGAWEPPDSSGPLPVGKGKEARYGFPYGNETSC